MVTWQIKNVISPLSQGLWTPNVAGWWLRMRGLHLQSHVTHQSRAHVSIKNVLSPHSQGPRLMAHGLQLHGSWPSRPRVHVSWPRTWYCAESGWGSPTLKVTWHFNCVVTWKLKTVIFSQLYGRRDVKGKLALAKKYTKMPTECWDQVDRD